MRQCWFLPPWHLESGRETINQKTDQINEARGAEKQTAPHKPEECGQSGWEAHLLRDSIEPGI